MTRTLRRRTEINWTFPLKLLMLKRTQGKKVPLLECVKMDTMTRADTMLFAKFLMETMRSRELDTSLPFSHFSRQ